MQQLAASREGLFRLRFQEPHPHNGDSDRDQKKNDHEEREAEEDCHSGTSLKAYLDALHYPETTACGSSSRRRAGCVERALHALLNRSEPERRPPRAWPAALLRAGSAPAKWVRLEDSQTKLSSPPAPSAPPVR